MGKISVIVPVYRAEKFIKKNLRFMKKEFSKLELDFEIIAVIDGYVDNSLREAKKVKGIKVVGYKKNKGKGGALKYGFKYVTGDYVTFIDCDMDINPKQLTNFLPYMATADIVIGSKRHPFSKLNYPLIRKFLSKGFQLYTWLLLGLNLTDTQTGLKLIKRDVLEVIMPLLLVKNYAFDVEMCFLAIKHGFRVVESPINIEYKFNGTGINFQAILGMALDVLAIRYRYSILKYYQHKYHEAHFKK